MKLNPNLNALFLNKSAFILIVIITIGFFFRLDQFFIQTLLDDEWHAIHKILNSSPKSIFYSFGFADYCIPLTLLYWLESQLFGLSELLMRWPMMLTGLLTITLFPLYIFKGNKKIAALIFAYFLAFSPLLITYSRTARPYAITLFLVYISIYLFYKIYQDVKNNKTNLALYSIISSLAVWLHLITALFIIAPYLYEAAKLLFRPKKGNSKKIISLFFMGLPSAFLIALLVLPPLINDMASLAGKTGKDLPNLDTIKGMFYLFTGTHSKTLVIICSMLSLIGIWRITKQYSWLNSILIGFILTLIFIIVVKPTWIQHSLTFSRYLLPGMIIYLLSIAFGMVVLYDKFIIKIKYSKIISAVLILCFLYFYTIKSPLIEFIRNPNSNTNHAIYSFEYRKDKNLIADHIYNQQISKFWNSLSTNPMQYKIAVVPSYYVSYDWFATEWEKTSRQNIVPGYSSGLCKDSKKGEVPNNEYFKFKNISYPGLPDDLHKRNIDFIVFQKINRSIGPNPHLEFKECNIKLREIYGEAIYEDDLIFVYKTKN